jgi:hypothetical protein
MVFELSAAVNGKSFVQQALTPSMKAIDSAEFFMYVDNDHMIQQNYCCV